jgi:KDO2-lipid IV(A) lauroyltransferase
MKRWLNRINRRLLLRYRFEYVVALFLVYGVRAMSPAFAWNAARAVGRLTYRLGVRRRTVRTNLALALPEKTEEERETIARKTYEHFASVLVDILLQRRMLSRRTLFRRITFTGWTHDYLAHYGLRGLRRRSKSVLYLTAHCGNWEMASGLFAMMGIDIVPVFRAVRNPYLDRLLRQVRLGSQRDVVERRGAVSAMMEIFERGGNVGMLFDQEAVYGLRVPFFGREAPTHKTPAVIARDHGITIYFGVMIRRGDHFRYEARGQRIDDVQRTDDRRKDVFDITCDLIRRLEDEIRGHPEQYLWMHRRWKRAGLHGETS